MKSENHSSSNQPTKQISETSNHPNNPFFHSFSCHHPFHRFNPKLVNNFYSIFICFKDFFPLNDFRKFIWLSCGFGWWSCWLMVVWYGVGGMAMLRCFFSFSFYNFRYFLAHNKYKHRNMNCTYKYV